MCVHVNIFNSLNLESTSRERLFQALNSSKILGVPNSFRTAICFELLGTEASDLVTEVDLTVLIQAKSSIPLIDTSISREYYSTNVSERRIVTRTNERSNSESFL